MTSVCRRFVIAPALALISLNQALAQCEMLRVQGRAGDESGRGVQVSGDRLVFSQGRDVHVMRWTGAQWADESRLSLPSRVYCVAIHGDVIAVGTIVAPATRIYRRSGSTWALEATINAGYHQTAWGGRSLDLDADALIVGDETQDRAWVFRNAAGEWVEEFDETFWPGSAFGAAVAIDQDRIMIGAPAALGDGRAQIYRFDGFGWVPEAHLGQGADDVIDGHHVDISGGVALMGVGGGFRLFRYGECGPLGPWCEEAAFWNVSNFAIQAGTLVTSNGEAISVYQDSPAFWPLVDVLSASGVNGGDSFGDSLALGADSIVVGAPFDDDAGQSAGSVYAFRRGVVYVDGSHGGSEAGICAAPFNTVAEGLSAAGGNGMLLIAAGTYQAPSLLATPVRIAARGGIVRLQR